MSLRCCEGGPVTAGCFHDHCTGAILEEKAYSKESKDKKRRDLDGSEIQQLHKGTPPTSNK